MPQQPINKEYNTFVKGIITEANPLTFPANASIDEENFVLNRDGSRQRRLGMEYEDNFQLVSGASGFLHGDGGVSVHLWENINEDPNVALYIIQFERFLYFFDALQPSISASPRNQGLPLELLGDEADILIARTNVWQSATLGGKIVFAIGDPDVFTLSYDPVTDIVNYSQHGLLTRDVWGLDDGLETDERLGTLSRTHEYNLKNQGWGGQDVDSGNIEYFERFFNRTGKYPSNADLVQTGKKASEDNAFEPNLILREFVGNTPAPKGHFILDIFDRGASRSVGEDNIGSLLNNYGFEGGIWDIPILGSGLGEVNWGALQKLLDDPSFIGSLPNPPSTGLPVDRTDSGMTVIASYAERFFYAGSESEVIGGDSKSPLLGHLVFFSQLIDAADKVGKCYQEADPTSDEQSDLVATDGGFLKIPGMSRCIKLVPYAKSLMVFAENGVWEISGGESDGFKATDFSVNKITDTGAISSKSIVEVEDRIYYWSQGGIYALTRDQVSLGVILQSISETTIQTLFEELPTSAVENVTGAYDPVTKQIRWMVNVQESGYDGISQPYRYNLEIIYDVVLEAFYKSVLPDTPDPFIQSGDSYVVDYLVSPGFTSAVNRSNVIHNAVDNVVIGGDNVVITSNIRIGDFFKIRYLTLVGFTATVFPIDFTFSHYRDQSFEDWATNLGGTGIDAEAFLLTGHETLGDTQRMKQATYLSTHMLRTELGFTQDPDGDLRAINPSSCIIQTQWDFANSANSGKFGATFESYRLRRQYVADGATDPFDYGWEVISTRSKIPGRGRALSLLFKTSPKKDCILLGWGAMFGVSPNV